MINPSARRATTPHAGWTDVSYWAERLVWLAMGLLIALAYSSVHTTMDSPSQHSASANVPSAQQTKDQPLPSLKKREELGALLEREGFKSGCELGVQHGAYSKALLSQWPGVERFHLVDVWAQQVNYKDGANVDNKTQDQYMTRAKLILKPWSDKGILRWHRNFTKDAVDAIAAEGPLDFIYVDARHDYCGITEDLTLYWPLVRPGGIMAGHDYETARDVEDNTGRDWGLCRNGERHPGAVKGAVDDFFVARKLQVVVTYKEALWNTWLVRKPSDWVEPTLPTA